MQLGTSNDEWLEDRRQLLAFIDFIDTQVDVIDEEEEQEEEEDEEEAEACIHPRVYGPDSDREGICVVCGELDPTYEFAAAEVEAPTAAEVEARNQPAVVEPIKRRPVREFDPIEVLAKHLPIAMLLVKRGMMTRNQMAEKLHVSPGTVSASLNYLSGKGLVQRVVGSRYWQATASAKAHQLVAA
ncbi:DeoR family transcriptional regulator [Mycobacterium noviomagense]|nr:DeoR family transcriptional regulator [Mycobacterium noviomagense]